MGHAKGDPGHSGMGGTLNSCAARACCASDVVESGLDGVAHELHPVVQLELAQGVLDVVLHGAVGDDQTLGDLLVRESLGDQPQDLRLAVGQLRDRSLVGGGRGGVGGEPAVLAEDQPGEARVKTGSPAAVARTASVSSWVLADFSR